MFREFRKRVYRNCFTKLSLVWGVMCCLCVLLLGDNLVHNTLMKVFTYSGRPIEINPGDDLSEYAYEKVRCTFKYVINPVTNFYEEDSPENPYTCGYIVLDDNRENPFCVFVPREKWEQMEALMEETWKIEQGESKGEGMSPVTVEGKVRCSEGEIYDSYLVALHYLYGEEYALDDSEVFYIDDASSVAGTEHEESDAILMIGFLFLVILYGTIGYTIVRIFDTLFWKRHIRRFMKENNLSEDDLKREFALAKKEATDCWVSPQYTFWVKGVEVKMRSNSGMEQSL